MRTVLQVRLSEEEKAQIERRAGHRKLSEYVRTAALEGIAPDVSAGLRELVKLARQGGTVGEAAQVEIVARIAALCRVE